MVINGLPLIPTSLWVAAFTVVVAGAIFERKLKDHWIWVAALVQVLLATAAYFIWNDVTLSGADALIWQKRWTWSALAAKPVLIGLRFSMDRLLILGLVTLPVAVLSLTSKLEPHIRRILPAVSAFLFLASFSGSAWLSFALLGGITLLSFSGLAYFSRSGYERDTLFGWTVEMVVAVLSFAFAVGFTDAQSLSRVLYFVGASAVFGVFPFGGWTTTIREPNFWRHLVLGRFTVALAAGLLLSFELAGLGNSRDLALVGLSLSMLSFIRAYSRPRLGAAGFLWMGGVSGIWLSLTLVTDQLIWPTLIAVIFGGTAATFGFMQSASLKRGGAIGKVLHLISIYAALGFVGSPAFQILRARLNWIEIQDNVPAVVLACLLVLCLILGVTMSLRGLVILAKVVRPVLDASAAPEEGVTPVPTSEEESNTPFSFRDVSVFYVWTLICLGFGVSRENGEAIQAIWTSLGAFTFGLILVWVFARDEARLWSRVTNALANLGAQSLKHHVTPEAAGARGLDALSFVGRALIETMKFGVEWALGHTLRGVAFGGEKVGEFFTGLTTNTLEEGTLIAARLARSIESGRIQWYIAFAVLMIVGVTIHFLIGF